MNDSEKILLVECDQRSKSNTHRIEEIKKELMDIRNENKAIHQIATSVEVMASRLGVIEGKVNETNEKIKETTKKVIEVENRPARLVAQNVNTVKVAAITAIMSFLISGIFLFYEQLNPYRETL